MSLGDKIRELRRSRGLRQIDLAARLGVPSSLISGLETGARTHVSDRMVRRIAEALELTADQTDSLCQLRRNNHATSNLIEIPACATEAELHTIRLLAGAVGKMPSLQFLAIGQYLEQWGRMQGNKRATFGG